VSWLTVVASAVAAILGTGGTAAIIGAVAKRKVVRVEVADKLNEITLEWAEQLKAGEREARAEAREVRAEVAEARRAAEEARREAADARRQVTDLAEQLRALVTAIHEPNSTIDRLRLMAHQINGRI
jgi:multidrug efflux pump subunit AcrA (membrane-fusion protein)